LQLLWKICTNKGSCLCTRNISLGSLLFKPLTSMLTQLYWTRDETLAWTRDESGYNSCLEGAGPQIVLRQMRAIREDSGRG
jgi:hypothetical protein